MIGILLLEHGDETLAADHVNEFPRRVKEKVVRISDDVDAGDERAGRHVEDEQFRRLPTSGKQPSIGLIQRHRVTRTSGGDGPRRRNCLLHTIDDGDLPRAWDVHKYTRSCGFELE